MMLLAATSLVVVGAFAQASASAAQSPDAVNAMRRLDRLQAKRDQTAQALATAHRRLTALRAQSSADQVELTSERANLVTARAMLARMIVQAYKSTGTDVAAFVFASGSFSDLINRVQTIDRIDSGQTAMIAQIKSDTVRLRAVRTQLAARRADEVVVVGRLSAGEARLDADIVTQRTFVASLTTPVRASVDAEKQRRGRLAESHGGSGGSVFYGDVTWYGPGFAGHRTADGEIFDPHKLTAASPWLPFNTMLRVTSTVTGRSVVVRVNDRGPFGEGVLDLSAHAAQVIHLSGWQPCRLQILSEP
jgi:rare lipoprotein A (peptidoglycan hydrolase)